MNDTKEEMTGYERMKRSREKSLQDSILALERLADEHKDSSHFLSQESYKLGLKFAINEIEGTEQLFIKAHQKLKYSDPVEAEREHKNQMNTLATLKYRLRARYKGEP
jgi:hypothetical protein